MVLTSQTIRVSHNGDGATTSIPVNFVFWDPDDLLVTLTDASDVDTVWVRGTQYTVTGGSGSTGTIEIETTPTDYTPAVGERLTILSNVPDEQNSRLPAGGPIPSAELEEQLDQIVRMLQQRAEAISRAIKLVSTATITSDITIEDLVGNAGKTLRVNAGETGIELIDIASGGELTTPVAVAEGGTAATTAAAALVNLFKGVKGGDIASASPLVIDTDGDYFDVTGTTGFSVMTVAANRFFILQTDGVLVITQGAGITTPGALNITTAAGDHLICQSTAANTVTVIAHIPAPMTQVQAEAGTDTVARQVSALRLAQAAAALSGMPRSYLAGMTTSLAADADHDITVAVGEARGVDDDEDIVLAATITKQIDATWATGTAAGGLSSSLTAVANDTWYHVFVGNVAGSADAGFDTSVTGANLIADHSFTSVRRIGSVLTDGSANIVAYTQINDHFLWHVPPQDHDGDPGTSEVTTTLTVPPGVSVLVDLMTEWIGGGQAHLYHPDVTGAIGKLINTEAGAQESVAHGFQTNTSGQVQHISSAGITDLNIFTTGWWDDRGKND